MFFCANLTRGSIEQRKSSSKRSHAGHAANFIRGSKRLDFFIDFFSCDLRIARKTLQAAEECKIERAKETAFILNNFLPQLVFVALGMAKFEKAKE